MLVVVGGLALSPDGHWLARASAGLRDNLFVVRIDGTGYRQVTGDEFRTPRPQLVRGRIHHPRPLGAAKRTAQTRPSFAP